MCLQIECTHCKTLLQTTFTSNQRLVQVVCKSCGQSILHLKIEKAQGILKIQLPWNQILYKRASTKKTFLLATIAIAFLISLWYWSAPAILILGLLMAFITGYYFFSSPLPFLRQQIQIHVDTQQLKINYGFWLNAWAYRKVKFSVPEIQQLYIRRSKNKNSDTSAQRHYALCIVLKNRQNRLLIDHLIDPGVALFLKQEIEGFLHLK